MSSAPSRRPGARRLDVVLVNERREIARLIELVEQFGADCGLIHDDILTVNLILDEMVSNVIKYGYDDRDEHRIDVQVAVDEGLVTIRIEDDGREFNPLAAPEPHHLDLPIEQRPIGGLGVHIVKTTVDGGEYRRADGRNILILKKRVAAAGA
jgi:serine/threonine-protein kinase RsbW